MRHDTTVNPETTTDFNIKHFVLTTLIVSIWINISEVFRYFIIVKPMMQEYLAMLPGAIPMNWIVFAIWGIWDTILTTLVVFIYWLVAQCFGNNLMSTIISATTSWALFFLLFWLGMVNMGLSPISVALIALPLSLLEMIVASWILSKLYARP
jgi:hypothetical protein